MRVYETDSRKPTLSFSEDIPHGCICQCPFCLHEIKILDDSTECEVCGKDLVFPTWCDW